RDPRRRGARGWRRHARACRGAAGSAPAHLGARPDHPRGAHARGPPPLRGGGPRGAASRAHVVRAGAARRPRAGRLARAHQQGARPRAHAHQTALREPLMASTPNDLSLTNDILEQVGLRVVGQHTMVERLLIALLTGGHVLLEGVPGLAKTLTVRTLAETVR